MQYKALLFDFGGVLSRDNFYEKTLLPGREDIYEWIQANIFGNNELVCRWMKGELDSYAVNVMIAKNNPIEVDDLHRAFKESVSAMELDEAVTDIIEDAKDRGYKTALVSDNMDVLSNITVPEKGLDRLFDVIVNSSEYGILKNEAGGKLFDMALAQLGVDIERSIMVDDSPATITLYGMKGGTACLFKNPVSLRQQLKKLSVLS